jgi:hypothetical protein
VSITTGADFTATVLDPDGIQSVTIAGVAVTVGADGAVSEHFFAPTLTIVVTDTHGKQTTHTRTYVSKP